MALTFIAVLIMCSSFITFIILAAFLLGHVGQIFGFDNEVKEAEATIIGFITKGIDTIEKPRSPTPIFQYYNEFLAPYRK